MLQYILRKLLLTIPLIVGVITLIFVLVELSPGDPSDKYLGPDIPAEQVEKLRIKFGLDQPAHVRYVKMLGNMAVGDFGRSFHQQRPVFDVIMDVLPNTVLLSLTTLLVMFPLGVALGSFQAINQNSPLDATASVVSLAAFSAPRFWVGLMLQLILGLYLGLLPTNGLKNVVTFDDMSPVQQAIDIGTHLILPGLAMGIAAAATTARYMRSSLLGIIRQDFVRTARAKGLPERLVMLRHGIRNALLPIVTLIGLSIPFVFSGSIIVEVVFGWPGMGRLIFGAIQTQDMPVLIACYTVYTTVVIVANLLADITYSFVDPRIRLS